MRHAAVGHRRLLQLRRGDARVRDKHLEDFSLELLFVDTQMVA